MGSGQVKVPTSWSAVGRVLTSVLQPRPADECRPLDYADCGDRTPSVFLKTPFREVWGAFSPDGRWVAYQSNESGRPEIYVRPFVLPAAAGAAAGRLGRSGRCPLRAESCLSGGPTARSCTTSTRRVR